MHNRNQRFGQQGESLAARYLKKHGYRILENNYRTPMGEIDIIARDGDTLVFVEVKARRSGRYGPPQAAVTHRKQRRISMAALHYLKTTGRAQARARFDVVAISGSGKHPEIDIIKNAFELAYG